MNPNVGNTEPVMYDEFGQPKKQGFMAKIKTKIAGWKQHRREKKIRKQARKEGDLSSSSPSLSPEREPGYTSPAFGTVGTNPSHSTLATHTVASEVFPQSYPQHNVEMGETYGTHHITASEQQMLEAPPVLPGLGLGQTQFAGLTTEQILSQQTLTQQPLTTEQLVALQPQSFISQLPAQTLSYSQPSSIMSGIPASSGLPTNTMSGFPPSSGVTTTSVSSEYLQQAMQQSPMANQGQAMTMAQFQELTGIPMDQIQGLPLQTGMSDLTGLEVAQESQSVFQSQPSFGNLQTGSSQAQVQETIIRSAEQKLANPTNKLPEFM